MKNKKFSMRCKFTLIFALVLGLTISGIAVANRILLGRLYEKEKKDSLLSAYNTINKFYSSESESGELEIEKIYSTKDISIYISDKNGEEIFSSSQWGPEFGGRRGQRRWWSRPYEEGESPSFDEGLPPHPPLYSSEDQKPYEIREMSDERLGASFIQLMAKLDNGNYLCLRTPMAAMDAAASTANELLIYIGVIALLLGVVIVTITVNAVTRPIRQLTDIAGNMAELNFGRKYEGKSRDEVGELGRSINLMSNKLEEAILRLKESNAQLEKDIELKNSIDKMRREFIANASHELKTPLALISGYAEGLKANIASEAEDRDFYCDVIIDESAKMDKIIKQFLMIAELDAAKELEKSVVDFGALVQSTVRSFNILARKRGFEIEVDCPDGVTVYGDEAALGQAVSNYITNALNHVDENKIIKVSVEKTGSGAQLKVYNSGKHIPEEAADRIWESFGKLDKARTRAYGGSGLGLAIVKKCVDLHGGSCDFANAEGGVEFFFEISDNTVK